MLNRPLFTKEFERPTDFSPASGSAYIFGTTSEPRSKFADDLQARTIGVKFCKILYEDKFYFQCDAVSGIKYSLRNIRSLEQFLGQFESDTLYIDITGLGHATWAALIQCALKMGKVVRAVYLEPKTYLRTLEPKLGDIFDLSDKIQGISPLPMFPTFSDFEDEKSCFVPLLGFEGTRFAHMFENVQPEDRKTFPIIGVPGYRPEYPFSSYLGNANPLQRSHSFTRLRFAKSNCPFSLYYQVAQLSEEYEDHVMKLGLVGTKPHALGAILYAIHHERRSEIIYDHVIRKVDRTTGADKCLVYGISEFMNHD